MQRDWEEEKKAWKDIHMNRNVIIAGGWSKLFHL